MDARLLETWLRMTADAVRGADDARRALEALSQGPLSPAAWSKWMEMWLPPDSRAASPGPGGMAGEDMREVVEEWWEALGVVPRYRYSELLKRYEQIKSQLEEAEQTVRRLRELIRQEGREAETAAVLDAWERLTRETLKMQEEWARRWAEPPRSKG